MPDRIIDGKDLILLINSAKANSPLEQFYWQSGGPKDLDADGFMLINLKTDSAEKINLSGKFPEIAAALKSQYEQWIQTASQQ
ncbi:hypothetical protein [Flavihumibacter sp. UBA7668]|uniref:hypothetical protein n=1 Tax=Flavihumibacter sp. UBA7668 TaxID=1946542 RepID=UPI0025BE3C95|nr:hypothetical protein [Flavihumibacter sp. UBA7668]